jgi:PPOX class probable F420-dependent enzyme
MADLSRESYVNLATFRKDGREVLTPVWFATDPDDAKRLWVYTNVNFGKVKRIRNNGRARVAACDFRGKLRGDFVDAKAHLVHASSPDWERGWRALNAKYAMLRIGLFFGRFTGRYAQRALIALDLAA